MTQYKRIPEQRRKLAWLITEMYECPPSQVLLVDPDNVLVDACDDREEILPSGRRYKSRDAASSFRKPILLFQAILTFQFRVTFSPGWRPPHASKALH